MHFDHRNHKQGRSQEGPKSPTPPP